MGLVELVTWMAVSFLIFFGVYHGAIAAVGLVKVLRIWLGKKER